MKQLSDHLNKDSDGAGAAGWPAEVTDQVTSHMACKVSLCLRIIDTHSGWKGGLFRAWKCERWRLPVNVLVSFVPLLCLLPCSVQTLNRSDEAHPRGGGLSAFLSAPVQMLISSRNTLVDSPRSSV